MRRTAIWLVGACMLATCASAATTGTEDRRCTCTEKKQADERLQNINDDTA